METNWGSMNHCGASTGSLTTAACVILHKYPDLFKQYMQDGFHLLWHMSRWVWCNPGTISCYTSLMVDGSRYTRYWLLVSDLRPSSCQQYGCFLKTPPCKFQALVESWKQLVASFFGKVGLLATVPHLHRHTNTMLIATSATVLSLQGLVPVLPEMVAHTAATTVVQWRSSWSSMYHMH